jgi:hypothetical protein
MADRKAQRPNDAKRMFSTVHSALPTFPGPFPLQNVKEQARERRTVSILPRFDGNATTISRFDAASLFGKRSKPRNIRKTRKTWGFGAFLSRIKKTLGEDLKAGNRGVLPI